MPREIYPCFVVAIVQMGNPRPRGLIFLGQGRVWLVIRTLVYSGLELLRVRALVYDFKTCAFTFLPGKNS